MSNSRCLSEMSKEELFEEFKKVSGRIYPDLDYIGALVLCLENRSPIKLIESAAAFRIELVEVYDRAEKELGE